MPDGVRGPSEQALGVAAEGVGGEDAMVHALEAWHGVGHLALEEAVVEAIRPDVEITRDLVLHPVHRRLDMASDDLVGSGASRAFPHG